MLRTIREQNIRDSMAAFMRLDRWYLRSNGIRCNAGVRRSVKKWVEQTPFCNHCGVVIHSWDWRQTTTFGTYCLPCIDTIL